MAAPVKLRLQGEIDDAMQAILEALPKDAIVRDTDDGVGRFAGERTLVIVDKAHHRLSMFRGSYGSIKGRFDAPDLDVVFEPGDRKLVARLTPADVKKPTLVSRVLDLVGNVVTVGAILVAYYMVRSLEVDKQRVAIVAVVGGVAWSAIAHYMPKRENLDLQNLVTEALQPITIKKKKKKDAQPEPAATAPTE